MHNNTALMCSIGFAFSVRWYVQLPTEKAHEFHSGEVAAGVVTSNTSVIASNTSSVSVSNTPSTSSSRLNPAVVNKIRSLVAAGETRLYRIRKTLRSVDNMILYFKSHKYGIRKENE